MMDGRWKHDLGMFFGFARQIGMEKPICCSTRVDNNGLRYIKIFMKKIIDIFQ